MMKSVVLGFRTANVSLKRSRLIDLWALNGTQRFAVRDEHNNMSGGVPRAPWTRSPITRALITRYTG